MRYNYDNIVGRVFGLKEVIKFENASESENGLSTIHTRCTKCGRLSSYRAYYIFHRANWSCQCVHDGISKMRLYGVYYNMRDRCYNSRCVCYKNYGARGIRVCDEWMAEDGVYKFIEWAYDNGYHSGLSIDRIDNDGPYSPDNCQWLTVGENTAKSNRNTRRRRHNAGKQYYGISPTGEKFVFDNASEFAREHSELDGNKIRMCANGKRRTHKNWKFGFVD